MKDLVEIQYSVLWKLCFDQSYFWLVETIIGIRDKQFLKKELVFCLVETVFLGQYYFAASRNQYWNKEKTVLRELIFWLVETIFFLHFSETPTSFLFFCFFRLMEKTFSRKSLFSASANGF